MDNQYREVPAVPEDFDGAIAVHNRALEALLHFGEVKKYSRYSTEQSDARLMLNRWKRVEADSKKVIDSYQLKLF